MLYVLKKAKPVLRKAIIKHADPEIIKTINEIALNTLNGNNQICNKTKKCLSKYKKELRCLSCPKRSLATKRKVIIQNGGFLPTLIATILSGVIGKIIENA
jgi:hypothetical protein